MKHIVETLPRRAIYLTILLFGLFIVNGAGARVDEVDEAFLPSVFSGTTPTTDWSMVAANPQRTSWSAEEVTGRLQIEWHRPIEAYISQNVQIIASHGRLYVSTSRGLYALNVNNGTVEWRFDTELPLGHSPTVAGSVVYVGGYDRKLHALDAVTGQHLWSFAGAKAGYDTNPLVVDGKVFVGNRDGTMYAIGAHGTLHQGELIWQYKTGGAIHVSAAYNNGVVYFASNDNFAYALSANDGSLVWQSDRLPGDGFHSFWPVIYGDLVIFSAATGYRHYLGPGTVDVSDEEGNPYDSVYKLERDDLFPNTPNGELIGQEGPAEPWSQGNPVLDVSRINQYLEDNPEQHPDLHKPWRRTVIALNANNGREYTFDSDGDGFPEYIPYARTGSNSGNRYPPLVSPDGMLYQFNIYKKFTIPQARLMGWNRETEYMSVLGGQGAIDEPAAFSAGGNIIYRNLCCDRVGSWFSVVDQRQSGTLWDYNRPLSALAPGYDSTWTILPGLPRLEGWYAGSVGSTNAAYHNHGDQNPIVPYNGRLYSHRSNAVIAFGPEGQGQRLPLLTIDENSVPGDTLTENELRNRLEAEIEKMVEAGHLRPGYYNAGLFSIYSELADYFDNPGDTLLTLTRAYPHLSPELQSQVRNYLQAEFQAYFDQQMYASIGWVPGAPRDEVILPPEVSANLSKYGPRLMAGPRFSWDYPPHNFYAMWKYAEIFPADAGHVYELAKSRLQVPVPQNATTDRFREKPYELNAYIAGYIGFLELQELAGRTDDDGQLRTSVSNELDRLLQLRIDIFSTDPYWEDERYLKKQLDIARNFIFLVPELGDYLNQHLLSEVQAAIDEYNHIAPYWFVARYEGTIGEGAMSHLYNYNALFNAKAYILKESRNELTKHLDVPAFARGDLFYIQNLVAALEAPASSVIEPSSER